MLQVLDSGISVAQKNMDCDKELLNHLDPHGDPLLHFYEWEAPSATYGYFANPDRYFDFNQVRRRGVHLARRPTGGGIVFHIWDFAFSFLMPSSHPKFSLNTSENYQFVNNIVLVVISDLFSLSEFNLIQMNYESISEDCQNFCMAKPTRYDVIACGMKVAGSAQRRMKQGYLHQGTVSLGLPQFNVLRDLLPFKPSILDAMMRYTFAPLGHCWNPSALHTARQVIKKKLTAKFKEELLEESSCC